MRCHHHISDLRSSQMLHSVDSYLVTGVSGQVIGPILTALTLEYGTDRLSRSRSQWPSGLRRGSAAAGIVGSNPAGGMDVCLL